jgi:hypothetical protein
MSFQVDQAFVQQYRDNAVHLAQQVKSRLEGCVRRDPDIVGANYYFERFGATAIQFKSSRHSPTPLISTPQSRRRVTMSTAQWADAIDNDDKKKTLVDLESNYMKAARAAFNRFKDQLIISAASGSSYSGQDGQTSVSFPSGQLIADTSLNNTNTIESGTTDSGHMSPQRLLKIGRLFAINDVDPDEERFLAVAARQIWDDLLRYVTVGSADYNTLKALAAGAIDSYAGFKIIMSNLLLLAGGTDVYGNAVSVISGATTGDRYDIAFARAGLGFAMNYDVIAKVAEDPGLSYSLRPYMEISAGATRIEEARVVIAAVMETA